MPTLSYLIIWYVFGFLCDCYRSLVNRRDSIRWSYLNDVKEKISVLLHCFVALDSHISYFILEYQHSISGQVKLNGFHSWIQMIVLIIEDYKTNTGDGLEECHHSQFPIKMYLKQGGRSIAYFFLSSIFDKPFLRKLLYFQYHHTLYW